MISWIKIFGQYFWFGLLFWAGVFLWFRYRAYPLYLKKLLRSGKNWVYIPLWWKENPKRHFQIKVVGVLLMAFAVFSSASSLYWLMPLNSWVFLIGLILFSIVGLFFARWSVRYVGNLELDCYFFEYRKQVFYDQKEGKKIQDSDIRNRTTWAFQSHLKRADEHGRFLQYIVSMAKSQKKPKDLYAEAICHD
jgi:hypothetical protein